MQERKSNINLNGFISLETERLSRFSAQYAEVSEVALESIQPQLVSLLETSSTARAVGEFERDFLAHPSRSQEKLFVILGGTSRLNRLMIFHWPRERARSLCPRIS